MIRFRTPEEAYLIRVVRGVLYGDPPDSPPDGLSWPALLRLAERARLDGFLWDGLSSLPAVPPDFLPAAQQAKYRAMAQEAAQEVEGRRVLDALNQAGIDVVPIKGGQLRPLYPAPYQRRSVDVDLYADPEKREQSQRCMQELGFLLQEKGLCHDVYHLAPHLTVEMHHQLFAGPPSFVAFAREAWDRSLPQTEGSHIRRFLPEDTYLYLLMHTVKHLRVAGTGIRQALDLFLYLRACGAGLDWSRTNAGLEQYGLTQAHRHFLELGYALFGREEPGFFAGFAYECDPDTLRLLCSYLFYSGAAGSSANVTNLKLLRMQKSEPAGKSIPRFRYMARRIFQSREDLISLHPALEDHPRRRVFYQLWTWARFFSPSRWKLRRAEFDALRGSSQEELDALDRLYREMALTPSLYEDED